MKNIKNRFFEPRDDPLNTERPNQVLNFFHFILVFFLFLYDFILT